ncbi:Probable WRKY transcription factor 75 [Linum perenne]
MEMNYTASLFPSTSTSGGDHDQHHHHHELMMTDDPTEEDGPRGGGGSDDDGKGKSTTKKKGKLKQPKYAFETRSQVDILDDGYRWRKYGQKAVKNNKFPRSYYRCTYQGCNVKKQVQRLTKDEGVVVTTYEGMHSHPIDKSTDNFEHILNQMHIYASFE